MKTTFLIRPFLQGSFCQWLHDTELRITAYPLLRPPDSVQILSVILNLTQLLRPLILKSTPI
jgi:hypothetical protein